MSPLLEKKWSLFFELFWIRVHILFQNKILRTFPGLILIFLGLKISPYTLSSPRFQNQFSLWSTVHFLSFKILKTLLLEWSRFWELSRICSFYPQLSSPGISQNKDFPGFPPPLKTTLNPQQRSFSQFLRGWGWLAPADHTYKKTATITEY